MTDTRTHPLDEVCEAFEEVTRQLESLVDDGRAGLHSRREEACVEACRRARSALSLARRLRDSAVVGWCDEVGVFTGASEAERDPGLVPAMLVRLPHTTEAEGDG